MPNKYIVIDRFVGNYEPVPWSGCWIWTGTLNDKGYGRFRSALIGPGKHYAHRVSYERFISPIPKGLDVLHRCDIPCCVNPAHLFLGTQADNNADRDSKGRFVPLLGSHNGMAKLDSDLVRLIRGSRESSISLSHQIDIDASTIRKVRRHELWGHV